MNDLTEKLKLSKIPNAEAGERIKVVIYSLVHLYVLTIVIGKTLKNLIGTPLKTQKIEWHGLMQELQKWTKSLSSEQQKMTKKLCNP